MTSASSLAVFLLPGWQNSDAQHWQSRWEALYGYTRVQQHDWNHPKSGDWQIQLEEAVLATPEQQKIVLVAHSLGCQLVARWAHYSHHVHRVQAALLVAPPDTQAEPIHHLLPTWQPIPTERIPFTSAVLASRNDPYCTLARAQWMAEHWGSRLDVVGDLGHINSDSGLGDWSEGHSCLQALIKQA
ncbi:alpha/beta hydrolase [Lampropedia puyangensis]|uniref:Alpha/beta hydrolase n=1 Tax=Lampropedia puyangensis TaxID=1330072 RepID=A0A4S8ESC6_9BURK|nr:alpha/beta hydrolase [Lampropedia puyangensis]THT96404.1 alpha/beta hydrolase [Lampropedia puyangensis]